MQYKHEHKEKAEENDVTLPAERHDAHLDCWTW